MNENILLVLFAVIVLLIAVGIWMTIRKRRTDHLRDRFGEEYDRTLDNAGDRTKAERATPMSCGGIRMATAALTASQSGTTERSEHRRRKSAHGLSNPRCAC